jgi:lipid A disaccharide synthetase
MEIQVLMPIHLQAGVHTWLQEFRQGKYVQSVTIRTDKDAALAEADWALVFPGTLTLELALCRIPMVILAVLDPLTLRVGSRLLRSTRLGLPNLLLQEDVFSEWSGVAAELTKEKLQILLQGLWNWNRDWEPLQQRLETVLGEGNGAANAAEECLHILEASH